MCRLNTAVLCREVQVFVETSVSATQRKTTRCCRRRRNRFLSYAYVRIRRKLYEIIVNALRYLSSRLRQSEQPLADPDVRVPVPDRFVRRRRVQIFRVVLFRPRQILQSARYSAVTAASDRRRTLHKQHTMIRIVFFINTRCIRYLWSRPWPDDRFR